MINLNNDKTYKCGEKNQVYWTFSSLDKKCDEDGKTQHKCG